MIKQKMNKIVLRFYELPSRFLRDGISLAQGLPAFSSTVGDQGKKVNPERGTLNPERELLKVRIHPCWGALNTVSSESSFFT